MTEREKVIKGLEEVIAEAVYPDRPRKFMMSLELAEDALALLKAQEPRVLVLDEIHRGMAVWLEDVDKVDVILAIGGSSAGKAKCFITANDMAIAPKDAEYGIRWRAWTSRPDQAAREAIPWGD